jgi:hypothetical protein
MPTGKRMGYGLLLATKSSSIVAKGMTINRKTSKDPKQNESMSLRTRAEICMAEIRRRNMKERDS